MSAEERNVLESAIRWRRHVVIAGPTDKLPTRRPKWSGALADAIDRLIAVQPEWREM